MLILRDPQSSQESDADALIRVIRSVRLRWRARIVLKGIAVLSVAALAAFLISAYALDQLRFTETAVLVFRILAYGSLAAIAIRYLIMPLTKRVSDERVALYLEEHEPSLHGEVLAAIEFGQKEIGPGHASDSPALVRRLVERAVEDCARVDFGKRVEQPGLIRVSGTLAGVTLMSAALLIFRPGFVSHSAPFLLTPWNAGAGSSPYSIDVAPGDAALPRGADLRVSAQLNNFESEVVEIALQRGDSTEWTRWPMERDEETGEYTFLLFNIDEQTRYLVEAAGVRSTTYRIEVRDLPYVDRLDLEYHFPAYTGLSPQQQEDGGDIAALAGTRVVVSVTATMPVSGGALVIDERDTIPLEQTEAGLLGPLQVTRSGMYRVLLRDLQGVEVVGSPDYYIDALTDQPPIITLTEPGRDVSVTSVDEVFTEVQVEDDYGVSRLDLVYSINGGPTRTLTLFGGSSPRKDLTAGHTFYLEEIELTPGDFISYYATTQDANAVGGAQTATTDIYFMEIRPFDRQYRQAESQGEPGSGGGQPDFGQLSTRQRQIVAATFKIVRDSADYVEGELLENVTTLALAQGRLREEATALVERMQSRGIVQMDSSFRAVAEALSNAVVEMGAAEELLGERHPQDALSPEQRALQQLQRAEAAFREMQVTQQQPGGGSPGGESADAEDLADLFELELDRLRNQYEEVDRGQREQAAQEIDEVLERLRELAQRQQQENERMRAQAQQNQGGRSGGGEAQRRLAEQAEEAARQLERLSREQSRPELDETARRLREAAEAMRRAAASSESEATARGQSALDQLREARRLLEQNRSAGLQREIEDALERAQRLGEQQDDVMEDVERLAQDDPQRQERVNRLTERKNEMAEEVRDLESQLAELSRSARGEQPDAAEKLQEAATEMRDARLADKILFSRGVVQGRSPDYARNFEEQIGSDLDALESRIREALGAVGESREARLERTLDRTRDLVNALESLDERMEQEQEGQEGQQGQGQQGREGQQGQQGQGQQGQRGGQPGGSPQTGGGDFSPDDMGRQFQSELRQRRGELQELRRELQQEGVDVTQLDQLLRTLEVLENRDPIGDPRGMEQLAEAVIPGLKEFEYMLRRQLGGADMEQLFLSGSDEVPPEYRELVEEYYRSLSRNRR
jgi:hypothetical protein